MSSRYPWRAETHRAERVTACKEAEAVTARQDRIPGFSSAALARATVLCVGAGGLGGEICSGLAKKGIGRLHIADGDEVETSNLARQHFTPRDLHRPKALRLAYHCAQESALGSIITGHVENFTPVTAPVLARGIDVAVVGVDSDWCRLVASGFFRQRRIPAVFVAVDATASWGWVFVQEPTGACLTCYLPYLARTGQDPTPCPPSPGTVDILKVVTGIVLYATDSLLMDRKRNWNSRSVFLRGDVADCAERIVQRSNCPTCLVLGNEGERNGQQS